MMKVPSNKEIADAKKKKHASGDLLKNAKHYQSNNGLPIRKMDLKTGENQVFENVQKRHIKPLFKKGPKDR